MRTEFITSSAEPAGFPQTELPEVAFLGRSNVGKSSLLNAIAGAKIARTSRTPGRTQLVNFFSVHTGAADFMLADLPGYGFARAPGPVRAAFARLIEGYVSQRGPLTAVLLLFDLRRTASGEDVELWTHLRSILSPRGAVVLAVGTKADKLSKAELKPALAKLARALALDPEQDPPPIATSASTRAGIEALRAWIEGRVSAPRPTAPAPRVAPRRAPRPRRDTG